YVRITGERVTARGRFTGLRVRTGKAAQLILNGQPQTVQRNGEFLVFGKPDVNQGRPADRASVDDPLEQQAAVHYFFLPEEVHLRAGGEKEIAMYLRSSGKGEVQGRLRLDAPKGITVDPASVDLGRLQEGGEKTVRLRLRAAADAANALHPVRIEPEKKELAAAGTLLVSVGVVMTEEKQVPLAAQSVIRA